MTIDNLSAVITIVGGGFFAGVLIGWALKKIIKLFAIIAGLFLAGLAYLQYQQIASINWDMVEQTITTFGNTTISNISDNYFAVVMSNVGIPLTGGMASGFTLGWIKG